MHLFLELEDTSVSPLGVSLVLQEYYQKMSMDWFNPSQAQQYSILDRKKVQNNRVLKCHKHHLKISPRIAQRAKKNGTFPIWTVEILAEHHTFAANWNKTRAAF